LQEINLSWVDIYKDGPSVTELRRRMGACLTALCVNTAIPLTFLISFGAKFFLILAASVMLLPGLQTASACTLFAAAGESVLGGGTIIAKNRDRCPLASGLKVFAPREGYRFLGLVSLDSPEEPAVAGINEKGLVVVDASPSSLAPDQEEVSSAIPLTQALLTRCASVQEVLAQKRLLTASYPVFEMVADRHQVAVIEIAPGGQAAIQVSNRGVLCHTNHFVSAQLLGANQMPCRSSRVRLGRIQQVLAGLGRPFSFADFLTFSQDRQAGPDNSINRLGSTPHETRTLATFVVHLSAEAPHIFTRTSNPGGADTIVNFRLDPAMWDKGLREKIRHVMTRPAFLQGQPD
jgi:isopenicillin-N N-acyltransferase-like protein